MKTMLIELSEKYDQRIGTLLTNHILLMDLPTPQNLQAHTEREMEKIRLSAAIDVLRSSKREIDNILFLNK